MDLRKLKTLIELVETSGIAELEIQEGEERVRITRALPAAASTHVTLPAAASPAVVAAPVQAPASGAHRAHRQEPDGGDVLSIGSAGREVVRGDR